MIKAKYTIVLKTLLDDVEVKPLIDKAMSTYPMYKPINDFKYSIIPTREELNKKIINHYKYREIGFETIGRFIDELEIALNEIMPYYYQLYKSADVINGLDDIFGNVDIIETFKEMTTGNIKGNATGTSKGNATSNTESNTNMNDKSRNVKSTEPQGNIDVNDIGGVTHADEIGWNDSSSNSNSNSKGSDTTNSESTTTSNQDTRNTIERTYQKQGNQGVNTYAHDMKEFRELVLNIEQMIIKDKRINELFMLVY